LILFLDTSALVKVYISEPGSERMRETVARGGPKAASVLAFAEMHATFARRRREDLLLPAELEQIRHGFGNDWERLTRCRSETRCSGSCPGFVSDILSGAPTPFISPAPCSCGRRGSRSPSPARTATFWEPPSAERLVIFDPASEPDDARA
jgi:hypothetical protein